MKLHLPKSLRGALLACFASVAGLTTTVATGTFAGGAFYVSLAAVAQADTVAVSADTTWSNADAATHADDTVTVDGGDTPITLTIGNGGTNALSAGDTIDFGDVTVNSGDKLKLHSWTGGSPNIQASEMVTVNSAITLNNAELLMEDGAYNFAGAITIAGESTISANWVKGAIISSIEGGDDAVLKLVRNGNDNGWDQAAAVFELNAANANFTGTVKVDDQFERYDGTGIKLVISNAEALINAVLDLGENDDVALRIRTQRALLKAIKGHGFIEYEPLEGQAATTELVVSAADGDYAGSSAANVNWTISGGNQGLNNASILGTYTVEEAASSTFSGNVTLGSLVNNSAAGINVANLTHLNIVDRTVGNGSALNLGTLSGYSADSTFTYGNGWTATWQEDGTASISTDHIFWNDDGTDGNTNWSDASNWAGPNADTYTVQSTDTVYLHAVAAGKTVTLTEDVTVAGLHVEGDYAFAVAQGGSYTLTAPITLASGKTFTKSGAGTLKLPNASGLLGKNITVEAGVLDITEGVDLNGGDNTQADYTVTVKSGAKLKDDRRLGLTGNTVTITGGGIYELTEMVLSREAANAVTLNVKEDTVLHVTGTYNSGDTGRDQTGKKGGSFMLGNWTCTNILNVHGVLAAEAGISLATGRATLNIESGGVLQMNAGLKTTASSGTATIHVKNGGALVVQSANTGGEDKMTVNMQDGSTVFAIDNATIAEPLAYASSGTVKLGAAADTILSLTATTPNVGTITILGTGDTVKTFANDAVSQTAAGGTVKYTNTVSGTAITLNAGAKFEAAAGLNLSGALTLAANSEAKLGGAVTVGSIANSGTIDVSELQSLRLGADSGSMGATVNLGAVSSYTAGDTFTYGNGWTATWQDNGTALITGDSAIAWADTGAEGDTDINWNTADNWSGAAAPTATDYVQLVATEGVSRTLALTADTTVAGLRVYDAYTLSVGEGTTAAFTATNGIELNGDTAKLSKAGTGTLSMTSAQAIAAKMSVTEGTLKLTDRLPGDAEANDNAGAITYEADLTALTVGSNGVLSILAAEKNSNNRTTVKLANFDGVLEITGGFVDTDSTFANATIKVNGGGLLSRVPAGDIANKVIIGDSGATFYSLGSTGVDGTWKTKFTGAMSGAGTLTIQERGDWYFAGDMSGFTGGIVLNSNYDHVYFQTSATVQSFSASARVADNAVVHFGDGTNKTLFTIKDAMTVGAATTFELTANAGVKNENQVSVSDNITFVLKGAGQYDMAGWLNLGTNSKLDIQENVSLNLAHTTQTVSSGEIAIATDATVNDSRALTIDGAYNISGAGAYNQLGSLALTANGALTLSGVVSINSLAGNNAGTITFADTLTSLELKDFTLGADYNIGTVTNGENVDWGTLLGYDSGVDFSYADGILSSVSLGVISWASPEDEDITWGGANWKGANSTNFVSISAADSVVLDVRAADSDISPTIELTANTTVAGLVVNDAYNLSIAEGATYSFAADSYGFGANGRLSKTGAGTLSMSLAQAQASKMHISEGTLKLTDVNFANGSTQDLSAITSGADGVLQLNASANGYQSGTHYGVTFTFSDDFLGTLKFTSGQVNVKNSSEEESYFGGAQKIILSQATLAFNGGTLSVPELVIDDATTTSHDATFLVYGNATIESALSGSGQVVRHKDNGHTLNLTGTINLTGTFINQSGNLNINSLTSAHFGLLKNTGGTTTISSAIGSDSHIEVTGGTLTIEATADLGRVTQSNGTININSAADISELSVTGGTFKINGAEVGVTTLKTGSALTLTGAAHLTAGLEDGSAVTLNGADTASATLTVAENGTANLQTGLVLDTLTVNAGGTLALNGAVTLDNLVNNAQLDLTNLTSLTLTQQQAYDGAVITGLGSLTGLTNNHFTYADGWLAEYDATNRTATILANAVWSDGGDDDNIIWADASNWTGGGTAGYTLQETDRVRLGTEAAGKQILVTADSTVAGITVRAPYTFSVADTESWTLTAPITFLENGAITKTGAGSLTLTSDLVTNELTVNEGTLTTGDVTPATGTTFTQSGSGTLVVDAVTANEVSVAGSMSATTAATADGTTFTKSGAGSLNVGTLTANEANVTGNMSATAVNLSDGNAFTKSGEGAMEIGTLNANSATVSAGSLSVDTATLKSGNTFTKAGANALELGTTNATRLTVSAGDLKMTAWTLAAGTTATKTGDGTLTIAGDASALKGNLDVSGGDVTFETDAAFGTLAVGENHVYIGTESKNVNVSFTSSTYSGFSGHMDVAAGSTLTAESVSVNNSTYRLHGAGVYNIGKLSLATSSEGNMLVDTGLTVNVTGTTTTGTTDGSFVLGGSSSTIDVYGTLSLASGISATANSTNHVVNVGDGSNAGATLWLKDGLHAAVAVNVSAVATINVKTGSNLIVDSANTANSDKFTVNLADGATVFTTAGGTILNAMQYTGTVKLGAAAGTTLDLTHAEQTDVNALTILGTADAVKGTNAGGTVAFAGKVSGASVTLNEGGRLTAAGGLNLTGALTLNSNAFATLNGEVSVGSLSNAGSIDVSGISALAIGDFAITSGATYNVGTLTGYESLNWNTLLGANESLSIAYNADTGYLTIATNMENPILWMGAEGATWDSTASDGSDTASWMQGDAAYAITPDSAVVLGNAATLGDSSDAVSRTILLDADTVVNSVTVQDAYALSVGADSSYSFDAGSIALEQGGSLSKTGEGTLSMSLEDAVAAQMAVNAGVLQISGVLADTAGGAAVGLSAISGSGTLHISPAGVNGNTNDGTRTAVSLGDAFTGTLKVSGGQLDAASTMGGAALVILDGATLTATGSAVTELAWNIQVSDNDAHLRHFGNTGVDERTSYATRLTGALSGGAGAMLTVIDAGEWFFAGDMRNYAGGLSINGDTNYVTFASDATLASLAATAGSRVLVTNSATVGATTTATSGTGTVYAGADANATLNLGAVTIANGTTLDITGGGTHTADSVNMSAAATGLTLGANTSLTVTGALNGDGNTDTETLTITLGENARLSLGSAAHTQTIGSTIEISLGAKSLLTDAAVRRLGNSHLNITGSGVYELNALQLSNGANANTSVTIGAGATLHITGTTLNASGDGGSLLTGTQNYDNVITVNGKLALECGISTHSYYTSQSNIYVADGGTIAFNQGLTAAGRDDAAIINIAGGGTLEVSGTDTTGTNLVTVNVADGAFIMGGNANGATGALIANNLVFNNGAYIGAKEGTTLTIAPEAGSMRINWLDIIGTDYGAGGKVVFGSDLSVGAALKILAGAEAEMQGNLTLTNVYGVANAGTLTLSGDVDAPTISNTNTGELIFDGAGLITLDDAMSNEGLIRFTNVDDMRITLDALEVSGSYGGAMRKWQIISNTGTLEGWTKDAITLNHFILNGETLSLEGDEWDGYELGADGSLTLYQSYRYWDSAGEDSSLWDTESGTVWRDRTTMEGLTYEANSRVAFGEYEDGDDINGNPATLVELNKNVTVAEAGVLAKNLDVFGTGYVFEGGKITVTKALSIQQDATFNNTLVIGDATNALDINVDSGKAMTLNTLETLSTVKNGVLQYNAEGGSFRKTGEGILSITGAVAGVINSAAVEAGTLQLGDTVSLTVGANRITGGSLQNVVLNGAGTSISAFAKDSDAVLTDVQLNAGSSTAYATVQDVTFAGTSTLTGYITFEQTQSAQDMQVAAGGSLTISNLTLDLHGLAAGEKQIILNSATTEGLGSISNWDTVKLVYSGVAVNAGTVDLSTVGVVKIAEKGAALYWDGLADGSAAAIWNTTSTNWSAAAGTDGDSLFYALSDTYFGATPEGAAKEISLMQDVVMTNLFFTEGGYTINGSYRMATLGDVKITHDSGDVTINTTLVAQGNIVGSGAGHVIFGGDTTAVRDIKLENAAVTVGADMEAQGNISIASKAVTVNAGTMSAAGDISIESGSSAAGDAGSFTLASGTGLSATNITIDVDGGAESDDHFQDVYVNAEGSINATGTLTITGSAAKAFAGDVAAGDVVVDQTGNKVTFDMLATNTLTITQGSTAHLLNTGASIRSVKLAGTLGFEKFAGAYGGHNIVSTSADAAVSFATITSVTLASLSGDTLTTDADGNPLTYGSITFGTNYRNLTINRLSNIQNITIGAGEYGATFNNATGGIHGNLTLEGGKLTVNSANIMANGTGQWNISGNLVLGHNTQTLAGNTISLTNGFISGNATHTESSVDEKGEDITINVRNQGLAYTANATINYGGESTISANMTLAADTTLTLQAAHATGQAGGGDSRNSADSLLLSGSLSGSAALLLQGDGVVTVSGANADYNGTVTVGTESTLELANTAALSAATISVQDSGTLQLNAGGTVNVADLQLADGAALSIFGLAATDVPSLADAALLNTDAGISWVPNAEGNLTLHVLFDAELENMKTYNLFNDVQSLAASGVSLSVMHNGVALDASQYKVGYDAEAKLVYIRTMLGNIWSGGSLLDGESFTGDGIWAQAANNTDGNWTGKNYTESQAAIFVDLSAEHDNQIVTVTLADEVAPGDVYFEADKTYYKLISAAGDDTAGLAAGTNIHKAGSAYVYLGLVNNSTMENAIGSLDLQAGRIVLYSDLAVQGDVFIGKTAELRAYDFSLVKEAYTAKGQFSNLTMTDDAIRGASAENRGTVTSTYAAGQDVLIEAKDGQSVLLENMYLQTNQYKDGGDALRGVTIGENVDVTGNYTLYGAMVFNNTLANSGTVTLDAAMTAEIGKLDYQFSIDEDGASWYTYQLVQGGTINGMNDLLVSDVTIGGVSLGSDGLADGVATYISSADGSITLSIGNYVLDENGNKVTDENGQAKVDGTIGVPLWDERWHDNTDEQPSLSRRYAGTDAAANVTFGEGIDGNAEYYWYSSVVSAANADKVNGTGDEVVATLSSASTGNRAAGGSSAASSGLEMWIFDRSGFDTVIGGQYTDSLNNGWKQTAATHVLVNSVYDGADDDTEVDQKTWVVGGSWNTAQTADSHVTIQNGNILNVVGGTYGANQEADSYVYVDGGTVYELFAGGYDAAEDASYYVDVANTYLSITGGTLGYHPDDSVRKRVYGGSYYGKVSGNVQITVDGDAVITDLVGGGYHGTVGGNITMDLVSGTVTGSIDAAGIGGSTVNGNVLVNLYQGFNLAEIYGGKQGSSGATVDGTSTLHFAEADTAYDLTQKKVQGFSHFTLADGAMVKVSTDSGSLRDASGVLTIGGAGLVELVGGADIGRNITLVDGATLWFNSDDAGNYFSTADNRPTITATAGTTLEITGMPNNGQGLCFWVDLAGHGVDGKGAMYKGLSGAATVPTGKVALPRITLSDSASIGTDDNICVIENHNNESELFLNGNTLTKLGDNALMLYNTTVKDNTNANAVVDGTIYVKEGTLSTGYGMRAAKTNIVVGADTLLDVTNTGTADAVVGALSGSGNVSLSNNLTLTTSAAGSYGEGSDWMTQGADAYGQFSKDTGFAYGVYSGAVSGSMMLNIAGNGTQYLSGSESTFTGGVHLKESATLYLLGSTNGAATAAGSSSATSGVVGTGAIAWDSADATLYLGDGVRVYNNGTTNVAGSNMIIGVEAAPAGDALTNYAGTHTSVVLNGVEYVEIATHNLYSISCDGLYADGTTYVAGSAINRDKMLLVTKTEWDAGTATVQGFSSGGYNEATYSGVLGGQANLVKVGLGTLVLDQKNSYTGSTTIEAGTLALKGWAQIGGSSSSAALNVVQTEGSTLMLAYDGTYEGEITGISNNIALSGTGDARWTTESRTGNATAALISDVGGNVTFSLTGNISGDGNLLHSGAGTLVLSGDSTYTGGTHATGGVVEVQSATGMGAGAVQFEADAALHATVEAGTTASRLTTTLDEPGSYVKGKVNITGTDATERVLSVNTAGYAATNTTVDANGTLLVNGAGVQAATDTLGGTGKLVVSDATASGAKASVGALTEFTGDMVVEGNKAAIEVANGNFSGGSISISGQDAKLTTAGNINIAYGEKLELKSNGSAASGDGNTAAALSAAAVNVAAGGTLSVSNSDTAYRYNLAGLQQAASAAVNEMLDSGIAGSNQAMGSTATTDYTYHFDSSRALNAQTAGMVEGGLTLNSDSRYEERQANISLAGGALTLNAADGKIALDLLTNGNVQTYDDGYTSQIVLFSGVSSLTLDGTAYGEANAIMMMAAADGEAAAASNTVYSTLASNYFTGWNITDATHLVYDVGAGVVYLDKAVPEPTTTTLSILALAALVARRRRK